jgi:hypothetical protein
VTVTDSRRTRPVRLVETRTGILLVPLTDEPMSDELTRELEEWQALGIAALQFLRDEQSVPCTFMK